jgi:hypothetical protein
MHKSLNLEESTGVGERYESGRVKEAMQIQYVT